MAINSRNFYEKEYNDALANFNVLVAENTCKLAGIQSEQGVYDFTDCDEHYNKAVELGIKFRGHCLIWHSYQPTWFENLKGDDLRNTIVDHITTVLTHYKGKIDTWNVVNEAISDDSTGEGWIMRDSFLYREVPDFIDIAFRTAHEVDPTVKLFYNDYDSETVSIHMGKTYSVYNFVKDLVECGISIDGVGLQYHLHTDAYPEYDDVVELMRKYAEIGVEVQLIEVDVNCVEHGTEKEIALQAELYGDALNACLDSENCTGFLIWGVGDRDSWRSQGYPLTFNNKYAPKPAYKALLNVLKDYYNSEDNDEEEEKNDSDYEQDYGYYGDAEVVNQNEDEDEMEYEFEEAEAEVESENGADLNNIKK